MSQREFIPRLEALRGVAAVLVGFYHCGCHFLPFPAPGALRIYFGFGNGMGCVVVFFVISGFVLARSLDRLVVPSWTGFVRSRAFRLLPAAIAVVALLTYLHRRYGIYVGFEANFTPVNVLLNMLLLKSDINVVMWSLTVEMFATPLIFAAVIAYRRFGRAPLLLVITVLFALSFVGQYRDLIGANLSPLYAFVVGVLVHFEGARLASHVPSRPYAVPLVGLLLFFLAGILNQGAGFMILFDCVAGAMFVLAIAQWPHLALLTPLDRPIVRFYGRISYSFYLLHMLSVVPTIRLCAPVLQTLPPVGAALALTAMTTLITAIPAYACYRLVEVPGIRLGRLLAPSSRKGEFAAPAEAGTMASGLESN